MGLRVLMISPYPVEPGVVNGGVESATSTLVPALADHEDIDRVSVLRFGTAGSTAAYRRDGPKIDVYSVPGQQRLNRVTRSYMNFRAARKLVREIQPDIVHAHGMEMEGDIAIRCATNSVVTVHGLTTTEFSTEGRVAGQYGNLDKLRVWLSQRTARRVLRHAKVVISVSEYAGTGFSDLIRGQHMNIPNPTAEEFFALAPPVPTAPRILFAGVFRPLKNPLGLVEAFGQVVSSVGEARLIMAGPQPYPEYIQTIRQLVKTLRLSDRVEIADLIDNERLGREISAARAVVLFSWQENAPTIVAQALAAGRPVIASRVGGIPEMVDDGRTGFLIEPGDVHALAERMRRALSDQELCLQMGRKGHEVALLRFQADEIARLTVDAYKSALN